MKMTDKPKLPTSSVMKGGGKMTATKGTKGTKKKGAMC